MIDFVILLGTITATVIITCLLAVVCYASVKGVKEVISGSKEKEKIKKLEKRVKELEELKNND
ncbi:hypothetical protein [Holzapfeliella sp. JNUCC 80]